MTNPQDEIEILAAELATGLLEGNDLSAALRLQLSDRTFSKKVQLWELRISNYILRYPSVKPDRDLWPQIESQLLGNMQPRIAAIEGNHKIRNWRLAALSSMGLAATFLLALLFMPAQQLSVPVTQESDPEIAELMPDPAGAILRVKYNADKGLLKVAAMGLVNSAKSPVLWVIPGDGKPRSLGFIAAEGETIVTVSREQSVYITNGSTLAVTFENPTAAPYQVPTMPIVASGKIASS